MININIPKTLGQNPLKGKPKNLSNWFNLIMFLNYQIKKGFLNFKGLALNLKISSWHFINKANKKIYQTFLKFLEKIFYFHLNFQIILTIKINFEFLFSYKALNFNFKFPKNDRKKRSWQPLSQGNWVPLSCIDCFV